MEKGARKAVYGSGAVGMSGDGDVRHGSMFGGAERE